MKLRLTDARKCRASMPGWGNLAHGRALDAAISAAEKLSDRKKARPLKQKHEKPSKLDRLQKGHKRRSAKAQRTTLVYDAVKKRAGGFCEFCGIAFDQTLSGAPEMDHFWGRGETGDKAESIETCWMLHAGCHKLKTDNVPSRVVWLERFRFYASTLHYATQRDLALREIESEELVVRAAAVTRLGKDLLVDAVGDKLSVKYIRAVAGVSYSNIIWQPAWPMRNGTFPSGHPCFGNPRPLTFGVEPETTDPLGRFRGRGYFASCFPEGDGISFAPLNDERPDEVVMRDIAECFGFEVRRG